MLIAINDVRTSFLYCFTAYQGKPDRQSGKVPPPLFKSDFLMAATHPDVPKLGALIDQVGTECKWKGGLSWADVKESIKANNAICLKRGSVVMPGDPDYKDMLVLKGSNKIRFTVIDRNKSPLTEKDGRPYSGCRVNAKVDIWAQDNEFGRRINCTITGIQFYDDGPAFGGGAKAADPDEFSVVGAAADAPAPSGAADPLSGLI